MSAGILAFGIVVVLLPMLLAADGDGLLVRADGLASIGVGLCGGLTAILLFRRGERWARWALWFYPLFWTVQPRRRPPPGKDHVHHVVFLALSLAGLLLPVRPAVLRAPATGSGPPRHAVDTR